MLEESDAYGGTAPKTIGEARVEFWRHQGTWPKREEEIEMLRDRSLT